MPSKKKLKLSTLRIRVARQFRECARQIAEGEQFCGCWGTRAVGGDSLTALFTDTVFPTEDRLGGGAYWLGNIRLSGWRYPGKAEDEVRHYMDHTPDDQRQQRVMGLLLCAQFVPSITRQQFRDAGYNV